MTTLNTVERPSRWYYALGLAIFFASSLVLLLFGYRGAASTTGKFIRVIVPAKREITLPKAGEYIIYYEYETEVGDRSFSTGKDIPDLQYALTNKATGDDVRLLPVSHESNYVSAQHSGIALAKFEIATPGTYTLAASYPDDKGEDEVALAIGAHDMSFLKNILGGVMIAGVLLLASMLIIMITLMKRIKARVIEEIRKQV